MRKAALAPTLLFLTFAFASGQAADPPPEKAMIEGSVINLANGRGVPRADVILRNLKRPSLARAVRADGAGRFLFENVDPGIYRLSADHQSYFSDVHRKTVQPRVEVTGGEHRKGIILRLTPAAVVTGQVVNEHSEPMQHVQVRLLARGHREGRVVFDMAGLGLTDDRGTYRIYDVRPGSYYVVAEVVPELQEKNLQVVATTGIVGLVEVAGTGEAPPERDIAFSPLFFPGTRDFLEAQVLPIGPGDEIHAGFIFTTLPSVVIRGQVTNGITGASAVNPSVTASWSEFLDGTTRDVRISPRDGSFEVRSLSPGLYTLRALFSADGNTYTAQQTVAVGPRGADHVLLVALPDSDIAGRVTVESPSPTDQPLQGMAIEFRSQDTAARSSSGARAPAMQFQTRLHPGDHYLVSARGLPADYYLKAVRVSGQDVPRNQVVVSDRRGEVELIVSPNGGHIEGMVVDDKDQPTAGAVVLIPEDTKTMLPDLYRKTGANTKGAFMLGGVPPGSYTLLAFDDIDLDELINHPELVKQFSNKGRSVLVSEKGTYSVPLEIVRVSGDEP